MNFLLNEFLESIVKSISEHFLEYQNEIIPAVCFQCEQCDTQTPELHRSNSQIICRGVSWTQRLCYIIKWSLLIMWDGINKSLKFLKMTSRMVTWQNHPMAVVFKRGSTTQKTAHRGGQGIWMKTLDFKREDCCLNFRVIDLHWWFVDVKNLIYLQW